MLRTSNSIANTFPVLLKEHFKLSTAWVIAYSFICAYIIFHPQLKAGLWLADDHQILSVVRNAGRSVSGYLSVIFNPDQYPLAGGNRLRPVYWFLRISEIFVWYDNGFGWHFTRFVLIGSFLSLIACGVSILTRPFLAIIAVTAIIPLHSIAGVWTRLGNAEAYGAVGVAAVFFGLALLLHSIHRSPNRVIPSLTILNFGIFLGVGSKENFFVLSILLVLSAFLIVKHRLRSLVVWGSFLSASLISIVMGRHLISVLIQNSKNSSSDKFDLFGVIFSLYDSVALLLPYTYIALIISAFAIGITIYLRRLQRETIFEARFLILCTTLLSFYIISLSQPTFHSGNWPSATLHSRYNFVGMFLPVLMIILSTSWVYQLFNQKISIPDGRLLTAIIGIASILFLSYAEIPLQVQAIGTKARTERTASSFTALHNEIDRVDAKWLTIEIQSSRDYEASISTVIHLESQGINLPIFVRINPDRDPHGRDGLLAALRRFSANGERGFTPIANLPPGNDSECISIYFYSIKFDTTECTQFRFVF